jgi:hypothetical protein
VAKPFYEYDDAQDDAQEKVSNSFMSELIVALTPLGKCYIYGDFGSIYAEGHGEKWVALKKGWFKGSQGLVTLSVEYTPTKRSKKFAVVAFVPEDYAQPPVQMELHVHNEEVFSFIKGVIAKWEDQLEKAFGVRLHIVKRTLPSW